MVDDIAKQIDKLYNKSSYSDKYGDSIIMTIIIIIFFFIITSYFLVMSNIQPIKDNWVQERCKPVVIPFSGLIFQPTDMSVSDFTKLNFTTCVQSVFSNITSIFLTPLNYAVDSTTVLFTEALESLDALRNIISYIRDSISTFTQNIYNKSLGVLIPLQKMFISIFDMFGKVNGVLVTCLYTFLGIYNTMTTGISAAWELMIGVLIALLIFISSLIASGFAAPIGLILLGIAIPMTVILSEFYVVLSKHMHMTGLSSVPSPSCFAKGTQIKTINGLENIENLTVGTILNDDSVITSVMILSAIGEHMHNLYGIIVSGSHTVMYNGQSITVAKHPHSICLTNFTEKYIYCFNTSNKIININNIIFTDWDDLDKTDMLEIENKTSIHLDWTDINNNNNNNNIQDNSPLNTTHFNTSDIHTYLESGFIYNTRITLYNNTTKNIMDIKVNDVLSNGAIVTGTVIIDALDIKLFKHTINDRIVYGASNLQYLDLGVFKNTLDTDSNCIKTTEISHKNKKLYHLLTDNKYIVINGITFYDYNGAIDWFLNDSELNN